MPPEHVCDVYRGFVGVVRLPVVAVDSAERRITVDIQIGELERARVESLDLSEELRRKTERRQIPALL